MHVIYLIWRVDFDLMENREPMSRRLLGYASVASERDRALETLRSSCPTYRGYEDGWGGKQTEYPKFEVEKVRPIYNDGADRLPCDGTCDYCRGDAPLIEAPHCDCDCDVHSKRAAP